MFPSDLRLLQSARSTIYGLKQQPFPGAVQSELQALDVVINELLLRQNDGFLQQYLMRGMELVECSKVITPDSHDGRTQIARLREQQIIISGRVALEFAIDMVTTTLADIVTLAAGKRDAAAKAYLDDVVAWEVELYAHRMVDFTGDPSAVGDPVSRITADSFTAYLRHKFPGNDTLEVVDFNRVPGGFSKTTFLVELDRPLNGESALALRVEPHVKFMELDGTDVADEYQLLRLADEAGLLLPAPLWFEDDRQWFGVRFIASRRIAGSNIGDVRGGTTTLPEALLRQLATALSQIHAVPLAQHRARIENCHLRRWSGFATLNEATKAFAEYWRKMARDSAIGASPLVNRGLDWLTANVPLCADPPTLVHGDVGLHNMLIENDNVMALLDWEVSRIGDPAEDLTNLFINTRGQIDPEIFLQYYRDAGGQDISDGRLRYFEVYHALRMCIGALASLRRLEDYPGSKIQFAVFGLRYIHYTAAQLNGLIENAEGARGRSKQNT